MSLPKPKLPSYSLSKREKTLAGFMALVLVGVLWFLFVYQGTSDKMMELDNQMAQIEEQKGTVDAQVAKKTKMQKLIDEYKAGGRVSREPPMFDNILPLTADLHRILGTVPTYVLAFDKLDKDSSPEYVMRGVKIDFTCDSLDIAEKIMDGISHGQFPCSVDSVTFTDSEVKTDSRAPKRNTGEGACSVSMHVTFTEKKPPEGTAAELQVPAATPAAPAAAAPEAATAPADAAAAPADAAAAPAEAAAAPAENAPQTAAPAAAQEGAPPAENTGNQAPAG